jgi:hypothetical protein
MYVTYCTVKYSNKMRCPHFFVCYIQISLKDFAIISAFINKTNRFLTLHFLLYILVHRFIASLCRSVNVYNLLYYQVQQQNEVSSLFCLLYTDFII